MKYNKDEIKEKLTIEQVADLVADLGGEPHIENDIIICKTICHNDLDDLGNASHKLYYYSNTRLFHCYTDCGESFDIFELIMKAKKFDSLIKAISYVAYYFNFSEYLYSESNFKDIHKLKDWDIFESIEKKQEQEEITLNKILLTKYDENILNFLPQPHIESWEKEGISYSVMKDRKIAYNPLSCGVVIPHYDKNNELVGIRERTLIKEKEQYGKYRPSYLGGKLYSHPLGFNLYNLNNSKENIKKIEKVLVAEGEKTCLWYASAFGIENDISVAVCGSNLTNYQVQLLLGCGAKEIIIGFDKQFQEVGDKEWQKLTKNFYNMKNKYGLYAQFSFLFDTKGDLLDYKDSPVDKGKEVFLELFKNRIFL